MATSDEGATPRELLIEASRRNNTSLLSDLLTSPPLSSQPASIAHFLNTTTDALGSSALHIAAQYGSYDILDLILDQEGVEIDGVEKREGDTALHCAVRFCSSGRADVGEGERVVEILLDAGCDPRIRNRAKLRAVDLVDPRKDALRAMLQKAEMGAGLLSGGGGDVVDEDEEEEEEGRDGAGNESD